MKGKNEKPAALAILLLQSAVVADARDKCNDCFIFPFPLPFPSHNQFFPARFSQLCFSLLRPGLSRFRLLGCHQRLAIVRKNPQGRRCRSEKKSLKGGRHGVWYSCWGKRGKCQHTLRKNSEMLGGKTCWKGTTYVNTS